jgi:arabinofuranosyltransferase
MVDRVAAEPVLPISAQHDCPPPARAEVRIADRLVFVVALSALALALAWQHEFFHDDAYVTLRYARRLLTGSGLTWNRGEAVEGFSSPLWLAQTALLGWLGLPLPWAARVLGVGYALATVGLWHRVRAAPAGLLALVTLPGVSLWAWGGLETLASLFFTLLAAALVQPSSKLTSTRQEVGFGLALAAVGLVRPEGVVVAGLFLVAGRMRPDRPSLRVATAIVAVAFLSYQAFRMLYFGDWLANAARAKTLGLPWDVRLESALVYVAKTAPQWLGTLALAAWMLACSPERARLGWLLLPSIPLLLAIVAAGGDHMLGTRFVLTPIALLCFSASLAPGPPRSWYRTGTILLASACACLQLQLTFRCRAMPDLAGAMGEIVGRTLEARLPAGTLVASATAGSIPYFAPSLAFLDTLGLNDQHIAKTVPAPATAGVQAVLDRAENWSLVPGHLRGDGQYVLSRKPDVILLGGANGSLAPWFLGDYQVMVDKGFRAAYAPWRLLVTVPAASQAWLADELDPASRQLPITLYARVGSRAYDEIARAGKPMTPLWADEPR